MFGFKRHRPPAQPILKSASPKVPFPRGYEVAEFRNNPALVQQFRDFLNSGLGGHVMAALINAVPKGYPLRGEAVNDTAANIELGRIQGFMDCMATLQILGEEFQKDEVPEVTYGADEIKEEDL